MYANKFISVAVAVILVVATVAFAAVSTTIDYQGYLKNNDETPVTTTTRVRFSLYSSNPARRNPVWQETRNVSPDNGIYSIQLGSVTPITAPFDVPYYLGIKVAEGDEMELQPLSEMWAAYQAAQVAGTDSVNQMTSGVSSGTTSLTVPPTTVVSDLKANRSVVKPTIDQVVTATVQATGATQGNANATNTAAVLTDTPVTTTAPIVPAVPAVPVTSGVYNGGAPIPATIQAVSVAAAADGLDPANIAWQQAPEVSVAIDLLITDAQAPQSLQPGNWRWVKVKAMHDGSDILFRFEFNDSSSDTSFEEPHMFTDAFAMQIPFQSAVTTPPIEMGNQAGPVNIIYWRASMGDPVTGLGHPQNIVAGGVGTVQMSPDSTSLPISSFQKRDNGFWTLVIKRALSGGSSSNGNMVTLVPGVASKYKIVLANWNGANQERNGYKLVSGNWQTLWVKP